VIQTVIESAWKSTDAANQLRNLQGTGHGRTLPTGVTAEMALLVVPEARRRMAVDGCVRGMNAGWGSADMRWLRTDGLHIKARTPGQAVVGSNKGRAKLLAEDYVDGVSDGDVVPEVPGRRDEWLGLGHVSR